MNTNPNTQSVSLHYAAGAFNTVANGGFDSDGVVGLSADEAREAARTILFDENGQARTNLSDDDRALGEFMATIAIGGTNGTSLIHDTNGDGQMSFFELADVADANNPAADRGLMIDADDVVAHYGADAVQGGVEITYEALGGTPPVGGGNGGTGTDNSFAQLLQDFIQNLINPDTFGSGDNLNMIGNLFLFLGQLVGGGFLGGGNNNTNA